MAPFHSLFCRKGYGRCFFHPIVDDFVLYVLLQLLPENGDNGVNLRPIYVGKELR